MAVFSYMNPNLPPEIMEAAQSRGLNVGGGGTPMPAPAPAPQGQATPQGAEPQPQPPAPDPTQAMAMGLPMGSVEAQIIEEALIDRLKSISKQDEMKLKPPEPAAPPMEAF